MNLRIAYYTTYFPYLNPAHGAKRRFPGGGMEVVAFELAAHMSQRGHDVAVFTTAEDPGFRFEKYGEVKVYRYQPIFTISSAPFCPGMFVASSQEQFDLVHAHLAAPTAALAGMWHAKRKGLPLVIGYSGDLDPTHGGWFRRFCTRAYNALLHSRLLDAAAAILPPAQCYADNSVFLGRYRSKLVAIPHGIDTSQFDIPYSKAECRERLGLEKSAQVILFVGWLSPRKGPEYLVGALPEVRKAVPLAQAVLLGTGELKDSLLAQAAQLGVDDAVRLTGYVDDPDIKAMYYKAADVFCLPSPLSTESFGIVNLEAMASGLPIVAANVGGVPEVVHDGENGLLVPPRDSHALATALLRLLQDEDLRLKMGADGRQKAKAYTWDSIAAKTEQVYQQVLGLSNTPLIE